MRVLLIRQFRHAADGYIWEIPAGRLDPGETPDDCARRELVEPLVIMLAPYAPHIAEELWEILGGTGSVCDAGWPAYDERYQQTMVFNANSRAVSDPMREALNLLEPRSASSE